MDLAKVLTRGVVVEQELVHPLRLDGHGPLLFLQGLLWGLLRRGCLAHEVLDHVREQRVEDPVEEVALWVALVLLVAVGLGQVVLDLGHALDHLRIDDLDRELGPVWDVAGWYVFLAQGHLAACEDVLQVLQARGLEGWKQVTD